MRISLLTSVFFLIFLSRTFAQSDAFTNKIGAEGERGPSPAAIERAAIKSTAGADHYAAMKYYERLLAADSSVAVLTAYAEAATAYYAFAQADSAYQKIASIDPTNVNANILNRMAAARFHLGNYQGAKTVYQSVLSKPGATPDDIETAQSGLENCDWATQMVIESDIETHIEHMGDEVNSVYSEYAPYPQGDTLYFSSYRFPFPKDKNNPDRNLIKVMSRVSKDGNVETLTTDFNEELRHTAHTTFSKSGNTLYYTNCDFIQSADVQCGIYMRVKDAVGKFGPAVRLPESINAPGYTTTQPNVGWDKATGQEVLYYVSDRPDGKGKHDIWYALILNDGGFSQPVNLVSLNTEGDDYTPYYQSKSEVLYFSSDGYQTLGGLDVFSAHGKGSDWSAAMHLGHPINSNQNDYYYIVAADEETAYFASNRVGTKVLTEEGCCYDIFKVNLIKPELVAISYWKTSRDSLRGTTMRLIELGGMNEEIKINLVGTHTGFPIQSGKKYMIIATKDGFTTDTVRFETPRTPLRGKIIQKLYLDPQQVKLIANVFIKGTKTPLESTTCRFMDLGLVTASGNLATGRGGAPLALDVKSNTISNRYNYDLEFNHRYRVVVYREGYSIDSVDVTTEGLSGSSTITRDLYLGRGINLEALAFDKNTNAALNGTTIRFYEIGGSRLETSTNQISNFYTYPLEFGRLYRVVISKSGYTSDSLDFTAVGAANEQFFTIKKSLYLRPSGPSELTVMLPVRLFFDNDEPDKRVLRMTTTRTYSETYFEYYKRKLEFINKYSSVLSGEAVETSKVNLDNFFEREVKAGYDNLQLFTQTLKEELEKGKYLEVIIKGFASPRAATAYNNKLTSRRINSVLNNFKQYENGVLYKYIRSGQLKVTEEPNGESKAPTGISDNIPDERNSWYSVEASRERRVEIKSVLFSKEK